jgi:hypothetical protein
MTYTLIFDAAKIGHLIGSGAITGLLFVGVSAFLVWNRRRLPTMFPGGMSQEAATGLAVLFLVFSVLCTAGVLTTTYMRHSMLRKALQSGAAQVVEGRVEEFKPTPFAGKAAERFTVCGVPFSYSDAIETGGFNVTSRRGGPIRAGLWVRISYVGDLIARLEIATKDPGEQADCSVRSGLTRR